MTYAVGTKMDDIRREKENRISQITDIISQAEYGISIKEISGDLKAPVESVRKYVKNLINRGLVSIAGKDGKTILYKWSDDTGEKTEETVKMEIHVGQKEYEPDSFVKSGDFCKQGDVIWCSSRSGDGAFFRYLVLTPWERKATVLGIFPEGHPKLNVNDPNYVFIGTDPGTGEGLYADVTNNCSRGYQCFGERLMHIDADKLEDVKKRLIRTLRIDPKNVEPNNYISSEVRDKYEQSIADQAKRLKAVTDERNKLAEAINMNERSHQIAITTIREELAERLETIETYEASINAKNVQISRLTDLNDKLHNANTELSDKVTALEEELETQHASSVSEPVEIQVEQAINICLREHNDVLKDIIMELVAK